MSVILELFAGYLIAERSVTQIQNWVKGLDPVLFLILHK